MPLVGRDELLDQLRRRAGGVVMVGPPGVGKTRLALAALESARGQQPVVVRGTRSAAALPLAAVAGLLPEADTEGTDARIVELFQAAGRWLREQAGKARPVLVIDDADLLDAESAALAYYLATAERVDVIATACDLGQAPDAVAALGDVAGFEVVDVPPLQWQDTVTLIESLLEGPAEDLLRNRLYELSGGNPLWVRELVRAGLDSGGIAYAHDRWRLRSLPVEATAQLREWVELRLRSMSACARHAAGLVALVEPAPAELVAEVVGAGAVDEAEQAGLIQLELSGRRCALSVNHPVYAEVLRSELPGFTRTRLLQELAGRLRVTGMRRNDDLVRVADWYLQTGGGDPEVLLRGAQQAHRQHAWPLVARLADAAVDYGAGPQAEYLSSLAALRLRHREPVEEVIQAASQPAVAEEPAMGGLCRAASLLFGRDRLDAAETVLDQLPEDPAGLGAQRVAVRAAVALNRGDISGALCAVPPCRAAGSQGVPAALLTAAISALTWWGRPRDACELADNVSIAADCADPPDVPALLDATHCAAAGLGHDLTAARSRMSIRLRRALWEESTIWTYMGGRLALYAGDAAAVVDLLGSVALLTEQAEGAELAGGDTTHLGPAAHAKVLAGLAEAYALLGQAGQAEDMLTRSRAATLPGCFSADVELASIALHMCRGEVAAASRLAEATSELAGDLGGWLMAARALYTLVRLGRPGQAGKALKRLAEGSDSPLVHAWAAHADAASAGDPAALASASDELARVGLSLHASEAAAGAYRAAVNASDQAAAHTARTRALAHSRACPGVTTPALSVLSLPAVLTEREGEIARLAAYGHTSPAIATQLGISTRTVDNHLQRAYMKLDVRGRDGLARLLAHPSDRQVE